MSSSLQKIRKSLEINKEHTMEKTYKELTADLTSIEGVTDIKLYTLVNNYGAEFMKDGSHFDLRRWANCYGADLKWGVSVTGCRGISNESYENCISFIKEWSKPNE